MNIKNILTIVQIKYGSTRRRSKDVTNIFKNLLLDNKKLELHKCDIKSIVGEGSLHKENKLMFFLINNKHTAWQEENNGKFTMPEGQLVLTLNKQHIILTHYPSNYNIEEEERLEKEKLEKEKLEKEKKQREKKEKERLEKEKKEKERVENERLEKERLEKEKKELKRLENERLEKEKTELKRLENERLEKEKTELKRLENEKLEKLEKEKQLENEKLEKENEKLAKEKEQNERVRIIKEKLEKEKLEKEKLEKEKLEKEKEKLEKEKLEKEKLEKEKEKLEKEKLEKDEKEKLEKLVEKKELYKKKVYIVSNIGGGGSSKYLNDIINHYTSMFFIFVKTKDDLLSKYDIKQDDILFLQQLLFTDISVRDILSVVTGKDPTFIISVHDFCWFLESESNTVTRDKSWPHNSYLNNLIKVDSNVKTLFEKAHHVICPSKFCLEKYGRHFDTKNFIVVSHNDIIVDNQTYNIPKINNNVINIGMMQVLSVCKGAKYVKFLKNKYDNLKYKNYVIKVLAVKRGLPEYTQTEFYNVIKSYNLHALMHLNTFADTYSYTLSYSMNSGLPIIYNNFGAFKERVPSKPHYFKVFDHELEDRYNFNKLTVEFERLLDYIIANNDKVISINNNTTIKYNEFYDKLFL